MCLTLKDSYLVAKLWIVDLLQISPLYLGKNDSMVFAKVPKLARFPFGGLRSPFCPHFALFYLLLHYFNRCLNGKQPLVLSIDD